MDRADPLNWDDLRILLSLSQSGSTARAAKVLGISHQTVARRVSQLERGLGTPLVRRGSGRWTLTGTGSRMARHAEQIRRIIAQAQVQTRGGIAGRVSLACTSWGFDFLVLPALKPLLDAHPGLQFDLIAGEAESAGADLAIVFASQPPPEPVSRRLGTLHHSLFGTPEAIARMECALEHGSGAPDIAGFAMARPHRIDLKDLGFASENVTVTNDFGTLITAVRHGLGVAVLPDALGCRLDGIAASTAVPLPDSRIGIWSLRPPGRRVSDAIRAAERAIARAARVRFAA